MTMSTCNVSIVMFSVELISAVISDCDFNSETSTKIDKWFIFKTNYEMKYMKNLTQRITV